MRGKLKPEFFRRIRNEFQVELFITAVCFLLAFGLTTKLTIAITVACLRFAIPDLITALSVVKHDPDRWHGVAVALLFVAIGMCRTTVVAFVALIGIALFGILFIPAPGPIFGAGLITCLLILYFFLLLIFPSTFAAFLIAKVQNLKLYFAHELTALRRKGLEQFEPQVVEEFQQHPDEDPELDTNESIEQDTEQLKVSRSLQLIAIGSGISLSIVVCSSLFISALFPNAVLGAEVFVVMIIAFAAPPVWVHVFTKHVTPD